MRNSLRSNALAVPLMRPFVAREQPEQRKNYELRNSILRRSWKGQAQCIHSKLCGIEHEMWTKAKNPGERREERNYMWRGNTKKIFWKCIEHHWVWCMQQTKTHKQHNTLSDELSSLMSSSPSRRVVMFTWLENTYTVEGACSQPTSLHLKRAKEGIKKNKSKFSSISHTVLVGSWISHYYYFQPLEISQLPAAVATLCIYFVASMKWTWITSTSSSAHVREGFFPRKSMQHICYTTR